MSLNRRTTRSYAAQTGLGRVTLGVAVLGLATGTLAACASNSSKASSPGSGGSVTLSLVAYSTPKPAYQDEIAAFQKTPAGKNIKFTQSYGPSGDQSRAVASGLKADLVAFSLDPDVTRLVQAGLVAPDWNQGPQHGEVTDSVVAITTRKGNPKGIRTWTDLTRPGVKVVTPNPFSSGSARWNILAGYGAQSAKGANQSAGVSYLGGLFKHITVQPTSGSTAFQTFLTGTGDAVITYESEAITAQHKNQPVTYVVPDQTLLIENPIAITKNSAHPAQAKAFYDFLFSPQGQAIFAKDGYRPTVQGVPNSFPTPSGLFTIKDLGGWSSVNTTFFDPKTGIITGIEKKNGVSTGKS